jgi:hypothetical protein
VTLRIRKAVEKKILKILGPYDSILSQSWIDVLEGAPYQGGQRPGQRVK